MSRGLTDLALRLNNAGALPGELCRFVARFDRGEYWLAHEELEHLWLRERDEFSKGLIHLAAGLLHAQRGNWRGAAAKIRSARALIDGASPRVPGVHLEELRDALGELSVVVNARLASDSVDCSLVGELKLAPFFPAGTSLQVETVELPYRVRRYAAGYRTGRDARRRD